MNRNQHLLSLVLGFLGLVGAFQTTAPSTRRLAFVAKQNNAPPLFMSSFAADGSEYSSKDTDYGEEDEMRSSEYRSGLDEEAGDSPTVELQPVSMSKNSGNRFVAVVWDQQLDTKGRDALDLHYDRDELIEDHVMFCRKRNLYNATFNTDSMVDILYSLPILASDLQRVVGHALLMESTDIKHIKELLREEPILSSLTDGEIDDVPLYRWRHIRDYTLRHDDGRFGSPVMMLALDADAEEVGGELREATRKATLEYLINSERVIAAGPLHMSTEFKNDPSSLPIGDLILFNAKDRADAIAFAEDLPSAMEGLYKDMRVHFYNNLDITGKFVSEDPMRDAPGYQMKEAMEYWGYPADDDQTPWLNW